MFSAFYVQYKRVHKSKEKSFFNLFAHLADFIGGG